MFLQKLEKEISMIEELVLRGNCPEFNRKMLFIKKKISRFYRYYTQLADVEDECNGLVSEDRKVIKIEQNKMKKINEKLKRRGSK